MVVLRRRVERISPGDLLELATDVGPVPMNVGALLVLDTAPGADATALAALLARRLGRVRRLRQRLETPPWGLGRPYWVDDVGADPADHVRVVRSTGDRRDLLAVAVEAVTRPLSRSGPLWRAVVVDGAVGDQVAAVVVLHHVLADGIGGLAVLARLVDGGAAEAGPGDGAALPPRRRDLLRDVVVERSRALRRLPAALSRVRHGGRELGRGAAAPRCSLNHATGPRRRVATVAVDLAPLRSRTRARGGTVNDALLVAAAGAMDRVLRRRGEVVPELVVSVPVSARAGTTSGELGNRTGVMPVRVPLGGTAGERLAAVAARTREQKTQARGASAALVGPAFRVLAATGLFRWFVDRQHLVNSFLTNLRGPDEGCVLGGARVVEIVPITITAGNVGVAFAALSYAGRLTVTVIADPDVVPEVDDVAAALRGELGGLLSL